LRGEIRVPLLPPVREGLASLVVWLAAGVGVYLLAYGEPDWHAAFTYVFLVFWVFFVIWWIIKWLVIIGLVMLAVALVANFFFRPQHDAW
jgi:hypothetical protein